MKILKQLVWATAMVAITFFSACTGELKEQNAQLEGIKGELLAKTQKDSLYIASLTKEMDELYSNLDSMRSREERIRTVMAKARGGSSNAAEGSKTVDQSMNDLENLLAENRKKIASLQSKLQKEAGQSAMLKKVVDELQKTVQDKETYIGELKVQINQLQEEVAGWKSKYAFTTSQRDSVQTVLNVTADELAVAYYAVGTKKELKDRGILEGGFLKKKQISGNMDNSKFTKVDARNFTEIAVDIAKKAKDIEFMPPAPPASSYEISEGGTVTIKIKNAKEFWRSKYVIIAVK